MLDVTRPVEGAAIDRRQFHEVLRSLARRLFRTAVRGGGVRSHEDARRLLAMGADKIVVNTGALERPELITEVAESFGAQSVILSIDARRAGDGYEVMSDFGSRPTGLAPETWARRGAELGAGEILVTSIERDGSLSGYDIALCRRVVDNVDVPVLISGGAGSWSQFVEGIAQGGASAVCTSNIFHFTEASLASAKNLPWRRPGSQSADRVRNKHGKHRRRASPAARSLLRQVSMPDTRPQIVFDQEGICNACRNADQGGNRLGGPSPRIHGLRRALSGGRSHDCIVPWSGGKDSSYIAWRLKFEFGLNPLLVVFSARSQRRSGAQPRADSQARLDHLMIRPRSKVARRLAHRFMTEQGNPKVAWDAGVVQCRSRWR